MYPTESFSQTGRVHFPYTQNQQHYKEPVWASECLVQVQPKLLKYSIGSYLMNQISRLFACLLSWSFGLFLPFWHVYAKRLGVSWSCWSRWVEQKVLLPFSNKMELWILGPEKVAVPSSYVAAISLVVKTVNSVLKRVVMFWPKAEKKGPKRMRR